MLMSFGFWAQGFYFFIGYCLSTGTSALTDHSNVLTGLQVPGDTTIIYVVHFIVGSQYHTSFAVSGT